MSEETREVARRVMDAFCREPEPDLDAVGKLIARDHVFVEAGGGRSPAADVRGKPGFADWMRETTQLMPMRFEAPAAMDFGPGKAIGALTVAFRSSTSGVASKQRMWFVLTVTDGRVTRSEAFTDPDAALEAARS